MKTLLHLHIAVLLLFSAPFAVLAQIPRTEPPDRAFRPINDPATAPERKIQLAEAFLANTDPAYLNSNNRDNVLLILVAFGGPPASAARADLERLYVQFQNQPPLESLDALIARKRNEFAP